MNNNKTNKHSETHFVLDMNQLKPGDIILERGYAKHSEIISKHTNSHYSHAMIYANGTIVEATQNGGVFTRVPNRFTVKDIRDLKVLRLKHSPGEETLKSIYEYAIYLCGSQYSILEAIKVKSPDFVKEFVNDGRKQFCSRLVAQCYQKGGINLVDNTNYCSPGDIERSPLLEEVAGAVRCATEEEVLHAQAETPHSIHAQNTNKFITKALDIFKNHDITTIGNNQEEIAITTLSDIFTAAYNYCLHNTYPYLDKEITNAMYSSGYLDHIDMDRKQNPYRYDLVLFKEKMMDFFGKNILSLLNHLKTEIKISQREVDNRLNDYIEKRNLLQKTGFRFIEAQLKIPKALLEQALERTHTIKSFLCGFESINLEVECDKIIERITQQAPELIKVIDQSTNA